MRTALFVAATASAFLAGAPAIAKEPPPAKNTITVFVNKGNASSVTKEINKVHAKMEADGWVYRDMGVYTEDGDLEGIFVTYVRPQHPPVAVPTAPAAPAAAPATPAASDAPGAPAAEATTTSPAP